MYKYLTTITLACRWKERYKYMNIKDKIKKNGQKVYYASVYLGVDQLTGKKARTTVTASTRKGVKIKARDALNNFAMNGLKLSQP